LMVACFSYYLVEQPSLQARGRLIRAFHLYSARREDRRLQKIRG
jgi:hypothetical protein